MHAQVTEKAVFRRSLPKAFGASAAVVALALAMVLPVAAQAEDVTTHVVKPSGVIPHEVTSPPSANPTSADPTDPAPSTTAAPTDGPAASTAGPCFGCKPEPKPEPTEPPDDGLPTDRGHPSPGHENDRELGLKDPREIGQLHCGPGSITFSSQSVWDQLTNPIWEAITVGLAHSYDDPNLDIDTVGFFLDLDVETQPRRNCFNTRNP